MKNFTILAFICLLFSSKALAQADKFSFGIRVNPLITSVRVTDEDKNVVNLNEKGRAGIGFGLIAAYNFTEKFAFYSGANIVSKGYKFKGTDSKINLTYLEIPIALKLRTNEISNGIAFRFLAGLSGNIAVGGKTEVAGNTKKGTGDYVVVVPDALIGLGVEWTKDNIGTFDLGVSYHHGLSKVRKTPNTNDPIIKLSYVSLDLGYYF
jgi:hypothetical protein